jgi:hypothetical protein
MLEDLPARSSFTPTLPPSGEGARRADEGLATYSKFKCLYSLQDPHPALRATFSRREKGEVKLRARTQGALHA